MEKICSCLYCEKSFITKWRRNYCDRVCYRNYLLKIEKEILWSRAMVEIGDELRCFLREIKRKAYFCDLLDCFKIVHYYTYIFGEKTTKLETRDELEMMRIELENWLEKMNLVSYESC